LKGRWVEMNGHVLEYPNYVLMLYDEARIGNWESVHEVINEHWNDVLALATEVLSRALINLSVASVVWDMVYRLRERMDEEGADFWKVRGIGSVVGWIEEEGVIAKVLVDGMNKRILVTVEGKLNENVGRWKVALDVGKWIVSDFTFVLILEKGDKG
jgi:hypothetical protein